MRNNPDFVLSGDTNDQGLIISDCLFKVVPVSRRMRRLCRIGELNKAVTNPQQEYLFLKQHEINSMLATRVAFDFRLKPEYTIQADLEWKDARPGRVLIHPTVQKRPNVKSLLIIYEWEDKEVLPHEWKEFLHERGDEKTLSLPFADFLLYLTSGLVK